ncbi:lysophospholipid acyltransferase family protein [Chlorobium sp. N1]|uniref:lysophospholipid acyltransferase family protein n=1 Tax=Chlorobium sp. N1 TaxID=2491138 RepID=UPI0010396067|nr:lysophospholipid acyltransferase family protein [Chlorobium sp. N1]TCD48056.1 1-acyl-sn-glycerol-3-phosphate acyltransferase [Chlorobium sp. N1]
MNARTLLFFIILIPIMFFGMLYGYVLNLLDGNGDRFARIASWWGRFSARLFGIRVEVEGEENYTPGRSYLVVSNHAGMADIPLLLGSMKLNLRFVAKEELGRIPVFGWALRNGGYVMIKRGQNREALKSLLSAAEVLKSGRSVHIFPEGTRSATGKLLPFKRGAFLVAEKARAEVLPVTIVGSHRITPKKSLAIHRGTVRLIIGKPLRTADFPNVEALMKASREAIARNLG